MSIDRIEKAERASDTLGIVLPGFLAFRTEEKYLDLARQLNQAGIDALRMTPEGHLVDDFDYSVYTQTNYLDSLSQIIEEQRKEYDKLLCLGMCWGALVALLYAARHQDIDGVVAIMPTRSFIWCNPYDETKTQGWREQGTRLFPGTEWSALNKDAVVPFTTVEDAVSYDLLEYAGDITCPVLMIGGSKDTMVPISWLRALEGELTNSEVELAIIDDGHDYDPPRVRGLIGSWVSKHLQAKP